MTQQATSPIRQPSVSRTPGWLAALAGVAAAAVALGIAEVIAVFTGARSAPLVAVGGVVVDTVPEPLKQFAIALFGVHDKTALLIGTAVLLAGFAAVIGVAAARRPIVGDLGIAVFGLIGAVAAVTRPQLGVAAVLPALLGSLAAAMLLRALVTGPLRPTGAAEPVSPAAADPVTMPGVGAADRRRFLSAVGVSVGAAALAGASGRWAAQRRSVVTARAAVMLPAATDVAVPLPSGVDPQVPGLSRYVTANSDFYRIDTALVVPRIDPDQWQLRIHGRVATEITVSYADLLGMDLVERYVTLACVSNEVGGDLIGNARWLGVPVRELLTAAGPLPGADQVVGRSADGWTCGTPTEALLDGRDALLAVGMNGEPLPVEHGFPVRMVMPGLYGYVSACKWITELELTSFADFDAYWVPRGWSAQGPIKTQSRIDTPRQRAELAAGTVPVAGVAWAQHRGISAVEVRVDDGPWQSATLAPAVSDDTWVQWVWQWPATPGEHVLTVRATDATGETQPEQRQSVAPDGATGWHTIRVTVA
ncbi:molybdopterin-dependent oxidoreductase [Solwaraspora sp. WMMD406]|uniref:molybdopterin-dependent oxidoreductase n=1 Tax=Solwaraspora sp. WMMD406 TaxID=3016095 RepID=UPI002417850C|nr:molybdopterin-dependent oxidoreductase [Solwaraspora sp. WMMD406]MDG4763750.1 molybdopterin-dependent oxidoreductase [Solwaraspora sp. WMMD406]